ncbi:MAG: Eco57I restriction-modification methylase domain-containing protein [Prevotellaceae bacterium]|nr:Eco57I restriction-modification methylase domain-containing protein [Candidatus Colivivens equi]
MEGLEMGKKAENSSVINIKTLPVQAHIGSLKMINDDWSVIAFVIDRKEIQKNFLDKELRFNCIYFLFGYEDTSEKCYVGQAKKRNSGESVLARLREHDKSTTEKYKDIWDYAVVVTSKDDTWTLDDLNALENAFYNEIPVNQNLNGNNPNAGGADFARYKDKISYIKSYITAIGFSVFNQTEEEQENAEKLQITSATNEFTTVEDLQNGMARIPEIVTPQRVVKQMVDMLPAEVWNDKTTFLDPACKGGEYLKEIYDRLMNCELLIAKYPDEFDRHDHILDEQLFGIALSQVSFERTRKKRIRNVVVIPNYISLLKDKEKGNTQRLKEAINREFKRDMKFDVVIGNPPYQETTGNTSNKGVASGTTIYDKFVLNGIVLSNRFVCMITPTKWFCGNKRLDALREKLLQDKITELHIFKANDIFPSIIMDKVCFYLYDKKHSDKCKIVNHAKGDTFEQFRELSISGLDCFIENNTEASIVIKVLKSKCKSIENIISAQNPFGVISSTHGSPIPYDNYTIGVHYTGYDCQGDNIGFLSIDDIPKGEDLIKKHKVLYPHGGSTSDRIFTRVLYCRPNEVCTQSYIVVGPFDDKQTCDNVIKYLKTRFARVLIRVRKVDQNMDADRLRFVPMQDFTDKSDIDWSKSINEIDLQLCKKYNLSDEEMRYIAETIKPMA